MRISDWSSDVCSSDLLHAIFGLRSAEQILREQRFLGGELGEKIILQRREMLGRHRLVGLAPPDGAFGFRVANGALVICRAAGVLARPAGRRVGNERVRTWKCGR